MPEGAEVKRISYQLNELISQKEISEIKIISGRYKNHSPPKGFDKVNSFFSPSKIESVNCKGKFIWFSFLNNPEISVWNTLGMTGSWSKTKSDHSRVLFVFSDKNEIYFNDIRNFGTLHFSFSKEELDNKLISLGPDMLSSPPTQEEFLKIVKSHGKKTLPEFLMNQKNISGVGNYVKAESLYLARLAPERLCNSLSDEEILDLKNSIEKVLRTSYNSGGSTIKTYRDVYGNSGNFTSRFLVYGNKQDPQGNSVSSYTSKDGRTTFWVPAIQK
jgi:formamidopyrimidine-DNA glycosylase